MPISTAEHAYDTASDNQDLLRRIAPRVDLLIKAGMLNGFIYESEACGGKGYPGIAKLTDCKVCGGSGYIIGETLPR